MTDTDAAILAERVEVFRKALMVEHDHDWSMETIAEAAHVCARAWDEDGRADDNAVTAAGAIWMALMHCQEQGLGVTKVEIADAGHASTYVWFPFMKSRYRITVRIDPEVTR